MSPRQVKRRRALRYLTSSLFLIAQAPPVQVEPATIEVFQRMDRAATTFEDFSVLSIGILSFFFLLRMDEFRNLERDDWSTGMKTFADKKRSINIAGKKKCVRTTTFTIPRSKTDQESRGCSAGMTCCCAETKFLKLQHCSFCPIHAIKPITWSTYRGLKKTTITKRLHALAAKAGVQTIKKNRKLINLHSFRRAGAQAALLSVGRESMRILGRWKSDASKEYENETILNPKSSTVIDWPLLAVQMMAEK
jgi:hypothetical protein